MSPAVQSPGRKDGHGRRDGYGGQDGYADRQRARNADYRRQYEAWVESMPPDERRQLAALGLDEPQMPDISASGHCDAAELAACSTLPEIVEDAPAEAEAEAEAEMGPEGQAPFWNNEAAGDLLRVFVGELMSRDNMRLSVECLALVTGLSYTGDSMTTIARRYNVTRAAVSKRCVEFTQALRLDPCRAMRSLNARQSYRRSRINQIHEHL